ncbi:Gfo/Idh/MocA family protein [Herbiconiux ginsengi]|uniref:Predicted dehydrogenase n=1 Tax=Herbiconiux ginsengi TaxID=381665 RepID=A0A1H3M084_9MICO|nr:Gfo/Idh/MocA family oxidoreductase [Herbiconiux ginsengi]SDY69976.1 Predicted dehydrogenase [Herbiconiux ginsengi]
MTAFRTVSHHGSLTVVIVGAGAMGREWMRTAHENPDVELVGVADLSEDAARSSLAEVGLAGVATGTDGVDLALALGADALIDVTIPAAHHAVTMKALNAGLPVLGEKPAAATVAEALSLAAAAEATGELFVVSQSRRYNAGLFSLRHLVGSIGRVGLVDVGFYRDPRFGGFREEMAHPLLLDMAIHPFDGARFLLGVEPVSVTCDEFNPVWSPFAGDAAAAVDFRMSDGSRFLYNASWASPGLQTSWNGEWRVSGEAGTVLWNGDDEPVSSVTSGSSVAPVPPGDSIAGSLADFVLALRTGTAPFGEVHENIMSLVMVEAAVIASERGAQVEIDEILTAAHREAIAAEKDAGAAAVLRSWTSVRDALSAGGPAPLTST